MHKPKPTLLFVYNADSGLFNTLADMGHKFFSPKTYACDLCMLTHGLLSERREWRAFLENLEAECRFLHRDQFRQQHPEDATALPAIFFIRRGRILTCVSAEQLRDCGDLEQLQRLIRAQCVKLHNIYPATNCDVPNC